MLQTVHNSEFSRTMDLFKEIDDLGDLFFPEKNSKLSSPEGGYDDLQSKYSSLHENYAKEIENSKKVETCLVKCLKFYSKLCKKYEMQQKIISNLEESIKEKIRSLEDAQKNEERLKGVLEVYRTERVIYAGQTSENLRKEKELLLDVCCKLLGESVPSENTSVSCKLIMRKFKNDLSHTNLIMLREKVHKCEYYKDCKQELTDAKTEVKSEDKYEITKVENPVEDTTPCNKMTQDSLDNYNSDETSFTESEQEENDSLWEEVPTLQKQQETDAACNLPQLEEVITVQKQQQEVSTVQKPKQADVACNLPQLMEVSTVQKQQHPKVACNLRLEEVPTVQKQQQADVACNLPLEEVPQCTDKGDTNDCDISRNQSGLCSHTSPARGSTSIFDISDIFPTSDTRTDKEETVVCSDILFEGDNRVRDPSLVNNPQKSDEDFAYELTAIFREMSSLRVLSPIRVTNNSMPNRGDKRKAEDNSGRNKRLKPEEEKASNCLLDSIMSAMSVQNEQFKSFSKKDSGGERSPPKKETSVPIVRSPPRKETAGPIVRNSPKETSGPILRSSPRKETTGTILRSPRRKETSGPILRSSPGKETTGPILRSSPKKETSGPVLRTYARRKKVEVATAQENVRRSPGRRKDGLEKLVAEEINKFVTSPISSKEDADRNVKLCVSALANKPEDVIAKCIVTVVLENVDEAVEVFERPAPPLTNTQHRLIILLSVFRTLEWDTDKISTKILSTIQEKLFPDNFFWPDDSVESVTRFYAALCKARNDTKTLWKFCLQAMTEMNQRCPLVVFTVLRTWPDVLHDASTLKGNILALTVVNIFLHMPKTEGMRNKNQCRKLEALRHLLSHFYQFKMEETLEGYASKVLQGIRRQEMGAEKSLVLLAKCRKPDWAVTNLVPELKSSLVDWSEGKMEDSVAKVILSVVKQICPVLISENSLWEKVRELSVCLTDILTSGKKSHDCEVNLIETLLQLKKYPTVRAAICEWIPKSAISEALRREIIDASTEKVLRELKLNRKKDPKKFPTKAKQWKKAKRMRKKTKNKQKSKKV